MRNPEKIYFPNLDALRSIACLFVLLAHILWDFLNRQFPDSFVLNSDVAFFFLGNGGFGVRIFFVLSGFLITFLLIKEIQKTGRISLKDFYIRRVLRIWPVYFMVIIFVFVIYAGAKNIFGNENPIHENLFMSVFFLSNYDLIRILHNPLLYSNGILSLTWSVSVEEQFYLLWPVLLSLFPFRKLVYVILGVLGISIVFSFLRADDEIVVYHHVISNLLFLGTGGLLAWLILTKPSFTGYCARLTKLHWWFILLAGLSFIIFLKEWLFSVEYGIVFYFIGSAFFLFSLVLTQVAGVKRPFELGGSSFLVKMGKYTYGLYMYHRVAMWGLGIVYEKLVGRELNLLTDFLNVLASFLGAFLLSYLSYRFMEKPLLQLKNRFSFFSKS